MKKHIIAAVCMVLILGVGFLIFHEKKLDSSDTVTDTYTDESKSELETYQNNENKEQIEKMSIKDSTGLCDDDELQNISDTVYQFENSFLEDLLTYKGTEENYLDKVQSDFADGTVYTNADISYPDKMLTHYTIDEMTASYQSVNLVTCNIREKTETAMVISVRGIINVDLKSNSIEEGNYDCIFRSDILLENDQCKVLSMELSKIFEPGVTAAWENENHITVQFQGNYITNWNIGTEENIE